MSIHGHQHLRDIVDQVIRTRRIGKEHDEPVNAHAPACSWRKTVLKPVLQDLGTTHE